MLHTVFFNAFLLNFFSISMLCGSSARFSKLSQISKKLPTIFIEKICIQMDHTVETCVVQGSHVFAFEAQMNYSLKYGQNILFSVSLNGDALYLLVFIIHNTPSK